MISDTMLSDSRRRALTGQVNLKGLTPTTKRVASLRRAVEEAEWLGEEQRADVLHEALRYMQDQIAKGYLYDAEF